MSQSSSLWSDAIRRLFKNKAAVAGAIVLVVLIVLAAFAPWIAPYPYAYQNLDLGASPPSSVHLLGTDVLGRDLLSRILYGARISLLVGFIATTVALHYWSFMGNYCWLRWRKSRFSNDENCRYIVWTSFYNFYHSFNGNFWKKSMVAFFSNRSS